jgi:hypothetical protein
MFSVFHAGFQPTASAIYPIQIPILVLSCSNRDGKFPAAVRLVLVLAC